MQIKFLAIILAIILLIGGSAFWQLNSELNKATAELALANKANGILQANVVTCTEANKTNETTITSLSADHLKSKEIIAQMNTNPKVKIITVPAIIPHSTASSTSTLDPILLKALADVGALQGAAR